MMKGLLSVSVSLLLLCVLWTDSQPVDTADTVREMLDLLRAMSAVNGQEDTELDTGSPAVLWSDTADLEKRDLPRLGVSVHRALPLRVHSSKSVDGSRYRLSSPSKWMSSLRG